MVATTRCLLALGANLGDRASTLHAAVCAIGELPTCQIIARSQWHETAPVGGPKAQNAFLNGALLIQTQLAPLELCTALLEVEAKLGRQREVRWDARVIDIDILLYGTEVITSSHLVIPHPRMSFRRFVLEPAVEIAADMLHPTSGWSIEGLLSHLNSSACYVAVTAAEPAIADWLAGTLVTHLGCLRLEQKLPNLAPQGARDKATAVESIQEALILLGKDFWRFDPELSQRLTTDSLGKASLVPVVSGYWHRTFANPNDHDVGRLNCLVDENVIEPALVIAAEPTDEKVFLKKISHENFEKKTISPSLAPHNFCQILSQPDLGPLARIQSNDPAVIIQEAVAAVTSAWKI